MRREREFSRALLRIFLLGKKANIKEKIPTFLPFSALDAFCENMMPGNV